MNYAQALRQVKHEVLRFFKIRENADLTYHNLLHTEGVVANAEKIAQHYQLDDKDHFVVLTAAWFHDTGYYTGPAEGHEARGAELAGSLLKDMGLTEEVIREVQQCILATTWPQSPQTLTEQIVCDADVFHFGTDDFSKRNKLVRKEIELRRGEIVDKHEWRKSTIELLEGHHYHTDYARQLLDEKKAENIRKLIQKNESETAYPPFTPILIPDKDGAWNRLVSEEPKPPKTDRPDKGIETMFRISSNNHQRLSDMADNKANIMITTTSIIISVLLSLLLRKLEDNPFLTIPTILLLLVCVSTMVFAILATRPSLPHGTFSQADLDDKKVNLLFFGNFYRMNYEAYSQGMQQLMNDREYLYGSLTKDIYSQGVVLGRKYHLLRLAYNIFMFGIIISVLAFVLAAVFFAA